MTTDANTINGTHSVIPGGYNNEVTGDFSFAFGNGVTVTDNYVVAFFTSGGKLGINEPEPHSTLHYDGSEASAYATKTGNYTLTDSDHTIFVNGAGLTMTLPDAEYCGGRIYYIRNIGANAATVAASSCQIEGGAIINLPANEGIIVQSAGDNWWIIADHD
ncbi:hypothetical protein J7L01_01085 [bacterium]|nr:hypothetical protein [bacterium]